MRRRLRSARAVALCNRQIGDRLLRRTRYVGATGTTSGGLVESPTGAAVARSTFILQIKDVLKGEEIPCE